MRFNAISRHKYAKNTITNIVASLLVVALATPAPALAFEIPTEINPTSILPRLAPETSHTYSSGTVIASASPVTQVTPPISRKISVAPREYFGGNVVLEGTASYYSRAGCLGCNPLFVMANGQVLDDNALTMAIGADKSYLVGYQARVTNLANGKSVVVRITDTGGFYKDKYGNRVADLTIGTKTAIGMAGGLGQVRVEVL